MLSTAPYAELCGRKWKQSSQRGLSLCTEPTIPLVVLRNVFVSLAEHSWSVCGSTVAKTGNTHIIFERIVAGIHKIVKNVPAEYSDTYSLPEEFVPDDSYFMIGNRRSIFSDSREFGPAARDLTFVKAVFVCWPTKKAAVVQQTRSRTP